MTLVDLTKQIDTVIRATERSFQIGEVRILAVLCLLLLVSAGSHIAFILKLS